MSPNSRKFESVFNSIVTNKLVNLKFPGFHSPVGSQEGFVKKTSDQLTSKQTRGIIYTDAYDGKGLKATRNENGKLQAAQILVASKFTINKKVNGKNEKVLVDLTKYLKPGTNILDTSKMDSELLKMFSFRIPTSAHQSGALIEIVGFLPHSCGDLMIVPGDHTTQIGEDYDIDTRYVYNQNYYQDEQGNIKKIDSTYIEKILKKIDDKFEKEQNINNLADDLIDLFTNIGDNEEIQNILKQESLTQELKSNILKNAQKNATN